MYADVVIEALLARKNVSPPITRKAFWASMIDRSRPRSSVPPRIVVPPSRKYWLDRSTRVVGGAGGAFLGTSQATPCATSSFAEPPAHLPAHAGDSVVVGETVYREADRLQRLSRRPRRRSAGFGVLDYLAFNFSIPFG
jgi:hypothetical protein